MNPSHPPGRDPGRGRPAKNGTMLTNRALGWLALICGIIAVVIIALMLHGCATLLTGTNDPAKVEAIMNSTHIRGCVYTRASGTPWASVVTYLVGTFGEPQPSLDECRKTLPPNSP